jgi:hypothetical protein
MDQQGITRSQKYHHEMGANTACEERASAGNGLNTDLKNRFVLGELRIVLRPRRRDFAETRGKCLVSLLLGLNADLQALENLDRRFVLLLRFLSLFGIHGPPV